MAALYADENFPLAVVGELQRLGHDVLTAQAAGQANQGISDAAVLAYAVSLARSVLTRNRRDFMRLHRQQPTHKGIIACTEDHDWIGQAARIHAALIKTPVLDNQLLRVYRPAAP